MRQSRLFLPWLFAIAACARPAKPTSAEHAVLFVSSDLWGSLGPCGCSEAMRGGMSKAAAVVASTQGGQGLSTAYFDAGNSLFASKPSPSALPQEQRKAQAMAQIFRHMGLLATAEGPKDLLGGEAFVRSLALPTLHPGNGAVFPVGGIKVGVVAGTDFPSLAGPAQAIRAEGADFVLGLLPFPKTDAAPPVDPPVLVDLIVRTVSSPGGEENRLISGSVTQAELQSRGRSLLRVDLHQWGTGRFEHQPPPAQKAKELSLLDDRMELLRGQLDTPGASEEFLRVRRQKLEQLAARREALASGPVPTVSDHNSFTARFVLLEPNLPSDPQAEKLVAAYEADISALNLEMAKAQGDHCPAPPKGAKSYVGAAACKACHAQAFPTWEHSKHARAFSTLQARHKQYDLDCVGCHVTGWQQPGGPCSVTRLDDRKDVGCESCHGPGSIHVNAPSAENIRAPVGAEICRNCHDSENSPHFDFDSYVPQILGPGHGRPSSLREE